MRGTRARGGEQRREERRGEEARLLLVVRCDVWFGLAPYLSYFVKPILVNAIFSIYSYYKWGLKGTKFAHF